MIFSRHVWSPYGKSYIMEYDEKRTSWVCTCVAYSKHGGCGHVRDAASFAVFPGGRRDRQKSCPIVSCPICGEVRFDVGDLVVHISQEHETFCSVDSPSEGNEYECICGFGKYEWPWPKEQHTNHNAMTKHFASQTDLGVHFAESILTRSSK